MRYILDSEDRRLNCLEHIRQQNINKPLQVDIKVYKKSRSNSQNAYWFVALDKYVVPVFREYGGNWDSWRIHEFIMEELGYTEVLFTKDGEPYKSRLHSKDMDTKVFAEMVDRAHAYLLTEHGINVPLPSSY